MHLHSSPQHDLDLTASLTTATDEVSGKNTDACTCSDFRVSYVLCVYTLFSMILGAGEVLHMWALHSCGRFTKPRREFWQ